MNKSLGTNLIAGGVFVVTYLSPPFWGQAALIQASLFALSGAITNWLAIHMLFEKIPGLYGSGIIPLHFEEFKSGIRKLIIDNFFTKENFLQISNETLPHDIPVESVLEKVDVDEVFDRFVQVIQNSSFGGMLGMFGGAQALEPLREPFEEEFKAQTEKILNDIDVTSIVSSELDFDKFRPKIESMIDLRLAELTPQQVKKIIAEMIRQHLGWLVVWGGVFGAFIGIISSLLFG